MLHPPSSTTAGSISQHTSCPPAWRPVIRLALVLQVAALQLSPEQRENIMGMRRVLMHNLGLLLRRRQELVSSLTVRAC